MPRQIEGNASPITVERNVFEALLGDRSLTIKTVTAAACVAIVALCVAVLSINRMASLNSSLKEMKAQHVDSLQEVANIRGNLAVMFRGMLLVSLANGNNDTLTSGHEGIDRSDADMKTALAAYGKIVAGSSSRQAALTKFTEAHKYYQALRDPVLYGKPLAVGYTMPAPDQIVPEFNKAENTMAEAVVTMQQVEDQESDAMAAAGTAAYGRARTTTVIALLVGFALAAVICVFVIRLI